MHSLLTLFSSALLMSGALAASASVEFLSERTRFPVDASRVIAFRVSEPAAEDLDVPMRVRNPGKIEVLQAPRVLAGEQVGYLRLRGSAPGSAGIRIGDAELDVHVVARALVAPGQEGEFWISSPATGSQVWGTFSAGVELFCGPMDPVPGPDTVRLRVSSGRVLSPASVSSPVEGPLYRFLFDVPADTIGFGPAELVALVTRPDGHIVESDPVQVTVARGSVAFLEAECEDHVNETPPAHFTDPRAPKVVRHPDASQGSAAGAYGKRMVWSLPFTLESPGRVQVMARVRGTPAAGGYPTIGLYVNDQDQPVALARVLSEEWQRIPIGAPLGLAKGRHMISLQFLNDFRVNKAFDRNLFLDRVELARIGAGKARMDRAGRTAEAPPMMEMMEAMSGEMMEMAGSMAEPDPNAGRRLQVVYDQALYGEPVTGRMRLRATCWWDTSATDNIPEVSLLLNGDEVTRQRSGAPEFLIDPSMLAAGVNRIQLIARLGAGEVAYAPEQAVWFAGPSGTDTVRIEPRRFPMLDPNWSDTVPDLLLKAKRGQPMDRIKMRGGDKVGILLPGSLRGPHRVVLQGSSRRGNSPLRPELTFRAGETTTVLATEPLPRWVNYHAVAEIDLPGGDQRVMIRIPRKNDAPDSERAGEIDLQSLVLEPVRPKDTMAPVVEILYPADENVVFGGDAMVVRAADDRALRSVELVVDGEPAGIRLKSPDGLGLFVFPVVTREWEPGPHALSVRVTDESGNRTEPPARTVLLPARAPEYLTRYQRAVRLLNRFAYGVEDRELAAILVKGEQAWLRDRLGRSFHHPAERALALRLDANHPHLDRQTDVQQRAIRNLVETSNPARARFVMWCENHFSTWIRKVGSVTKWEEHVRFSRLGPTLFSDLLQASATSPAMLMYLDQNKSFRGKLNENYAREIMELHTLGVHGGYGQADVTELARLMTGWTVSEEAAPPAMGIQLIPQFRFDPRLNDGEPRRVVGREFPACPPEQRFDRIQLALETLAAHPSTARFICTKLVEHYLVQPAPEAMVDALAEVFHETGGDLTEVLVALAGHPRFWDPAIPAKLSTPLDYGVHLARAAGYEYNGQLQRFLNDSGMPMFGRPSPDGYPEDAQTYADTNAFLQRWNYARRIDHLLQQAMPASLLDGAAPESAGWPQVIVDVASLRLLGVPLSPASNDAALRVLAGAGGNARERARLLAGFIGFLPEANLR